MMSLKQAKISIITTSYTMDRLKDTIELLDSIQAQTYQNIETVFVAERSPETRTCSLFLTRICIRSSDAGRE